jgi:hypothetical protein
MQSSVSSILFIFATIPLHIQALPVSSSMLCDEVLRSGSVDSFYGWNLTSCELHSYGFPDVVECFDNYAKQLNSSAGKPLHFAFVGDSRIRQAFHSFWPVNILLHLQKTSLWRWFLQMLPNYDRNTNEFVDRTTNRIHYDIDVGNVVLNAHVSFHWRPRIDNAIKELNYWAGVDDVPAFIFTGIYRLFLLK